MYKCLPAGAGVGGVGGVGTGGIGPVGCMATVILRGTGSRAVAFNMHNFSALYHTPIKHAF